MANPTRLRVSNLPGIAAEEQAATTSLARGAEMANFLRARLNRSTNREQRQPGEQPPPALVHGWDFWHDRQERSATEGKPPAEDVSKYEERLELLASVVDVKQFWSVLNNFDITRLALRDSIHLFHRGVKPVWEDPRNAKGGSWTFRVPKAAAAQFWQEICMMAIGEQLQEAVQADQQTKTSFRDDICGVSLSVRFNSMLIQIWNRDAGHQTGVENIFNAVLQGISPDIKPKESSYYYKKHIEHAGFTGSESKD
ncbi:Putative translation Initiation factor eIF- 4e [Septoria linicola]|uniref:Translation Initiation factor eIF- 4e n=1 Tax=Septoria linicola TaxID=215465 RepID=A0A9Q9ANX1_9PEZI|nr:putative translation Initiation factor eIF- 4e [Septoria linicola]USW49543.1 Putative translation Initiation factor eIF- 4e [Septoria linicola]